MMRVLVTGAGGFVGHHLVPCLRGAGFAVRPVYRHTASDVPPIGEIGPDTDWSAALKGVDAVVHLAAIAHRGGVPASEHHRVNNLGTRRLAQQAADCGVRRFVHISSVKAVADISRDTLTDDTPPDPRDPYGISKRDAEIGLQAIGMRCDMALTVLRPPLIYGPGVKGNFRTLLQLCDSTLPLPLGAVTNRRSFLFVGNLAAAIQTILTAPATNGTFFVADPEPLSTPDLLRKIRRALGRPPRLMPVPSFLLGGVAKALNRRDQAAALLGSLVVDTAPLARATGFVPPWTTDQGLAATADWYVASRRASGYNPAWP